MTVLSPPSAQQGAPRWCTPLRSREWDTGASPATGHAVVYSRCRSLSQHTTLPTPETLGNAHICLHQGGYVPQTARVRVDGDVPCVCRGESTERRPAQTVELPHLPTHRALLITPRCHVL